MRHSPWLPVHRSSSASPRRPSSCALGLRQAITARSVILGTVALAALLLLWTKAGDAWQALQNARNKPPLYERYHYAELALPQHSVPDPFADGRKYLWVNNHVSGE